MIREGNISFEFSGDYIQYDETNFYREAYRKCKGIINYEDDSIPRKKELKLLILLIK